MVVISDSALYSALVSEVAVDKAVCDMLIAEVPLSLQQNAMSLLLVLLQKAATIYDMAPICATTISVSFGRAEQCAVCIILTANGCCCRWWAAR